MLTLKYEGIDNWFKKKKRRYVLDTSYCFYALNICIAFGKQDDFT